MNADLFSDDLLRALRENCTNARLHMQRAEQFANEGDRGSFRTKTSRQRMLREAKHRLELAEAALMGAEPIILAQLRRNQKAPMIKLA